MFSYSNISKNCVLFLQETHSTKNEIKWNNEFDGNLYFSHGKPNWCGILIVFSGNKTFLLLKNIDWWLRVYLDWFLQYKYGEGTNSKHLMSWICFYRTS